MPRILIENRQKTRRLNLTKLSRIASQILKLQGEKKAELSLVFVTNSQMASLNKKYLSASKPTDVLAFPMGEKKEKRRNVYPVGDVVISVEKALTQAREWGQPFEKELTRLLIHGCLHLFGFRDEKRPERIKMFRQQEKILALVYEAP